MAFIVSTAEIYVEVYENVDLMVKGTRQQIFHLFYIIQLLNLWINSDFFILMSFSKKYSNLINDYGESTGHDSPYFTIGRVFFANNFTGGGTMCRR
jgi:hypothetical protein